MLPVSECRIYGRVYFHRGYCSFPSYELNMIFFFFPSKPELVDLKWLFYNDNTMSYEMVNDSSSFKMKLSLKCDWGTCVALLLKRLPSAQDPGPMIRT